MNTTLHEILGAVLVAVLSLASAAVYRRDHRARRFAAGHRERMESPGEFRAVYAYIRYSTLAAGLGSLLLNHAVWLTWRTGAAQTYAGMLIAVSGFVLFLASRRALGEHYSPCFESYVPGAVVKRGPYTWIRHPIYTANIAVLAGLAVATGSLWLVFNTGLLAVYYLRSAAREEIALAAAHPEYAGYVQRTGRFLPALASTRPQGRNR